MPFVKGQSGHPGVTASPEVLAGIRHLKRLIGSDLRNITAEDLQSFYRDHNGKIVRTFFLEYLKLIFHAWVNDFVDPDAKPANKDITIRVEVVAPPGKPASRKDASQLVTSTIQVQG